jgi:hypothetical protein
MRWRRQTSEDEPGTFMGQPLPGATSVASDLSGGRAPSPTISDRGRTRNSHPLLAAGRVVALVGVGLAAAGTAASITLIYEGVREIMGVASGSCGGHGFSSITTSCVNHDAQMLTIGSFGLFICGGLLMAFTSAVDGPAWATFALQFAGLFGALGANFYSYANHNVLNTLFPGHVDNSGWKFGAYTFWAVGGGALIVGLLLIGSYVADSLRPARPADVGPPIVQAEVPLVTSAVTPSPPSPPVTPTAPVVPVRLVVPPRDHS